MKPPKIELKIFKNETRGHVWLTFYVNREKISFSLRVTVMEKDWNYNLCRVKTSDPNSTDKNLIIDSILSRVNNIFVKYRLKDRKMTKEGFLRAYNRKDDYGTFHEYAEQKLRQLQVRMEQGTYYPWVNKPNNFYYL